MRNGFLLAALAMLTLGTAIPADAHQGDRRDRGGEVRRGRPDRNDFRHRPSRYGNHGGRHNDRRYRGRYYNNGHYYQHRYRHHGGWRYR